MSTLIWIIVALLVVAIVAKYGIQKYRAMQRARAIANPNTTVQQVNVWEMVSRFASLLLLIVFIVILFLFFPGLGSWLIDHWRVSVLMVIGIVLFAVWLAVKKPSANSGFSFGSLAPPIVFFVVALIIIGVSRMFAEAQGSNLFGASYNSALKICNFVPREAPFIPVIKMNANGSYVVDVPLTRVWTEVRLPVKNLQRVVIENVEPIGAGLPSWYEASKGRSSTRGVEISVGERGARVRIPQPGMPGRLQDWQWVPYKDIWPSKSHFMDSCLCPDGTVFGCLLLNVNDEWVFRIASEFEVCQKTVDRFYFGIDLPFGDHMAARGCYRVTFVIK